MSEREERATRASAKEDSSKTAVSIATKEDRRAASGKEDISMRGAISVREEASKALRDRVQEVEVEEEEVAKEVADITNTLITGIELAFESLMKKTYFVPTHFSSLKNLRL